MHRASGQPVTVAVDTAGRNAYVVCHSGDATPEGAAAWAITDGNLGRKRFWMSGAAIDPATDDGLGAVVEFISTGCTGPVGCALTPIWAPRCWSIVGKRKEAKMVATR